MAPRTMLPPPMTRPSETPISARPRISSVIWSTTRGSMPKPRSPASASPEILRRTRRYRSSEGRFMRLGSLADLETREPGHFDLLAGLRGHLGDELLDRLVRVLHEGLREKCVLLEELLELA